jgi:DNA-binding NtrC family response regulator
MDRSFHITVVDDESESLASICRALKKVGYEVTSFEDGQVAVQHLDAFRDVDLVVTDLKMPRIDGIELLKRVRQVNQEAGFLIVTGHGTVETAVAALKTGADDYILKPLDLFELRDRVHQILQKRKPRNELRYLRRKMTLGQESGRLIGQSAAIRNLLEQIAIVAPTRSTVLLLGESGTGKDLVAQTIHENSPRRAENFLPLNCAALSPSLLESELFGYEKGSFTGAQERRAGKLELANRGTLFLDEIGEMPIQMQVKLLRFLETRQIMRVGGSATLQLDVRLIAATNRDLERAVEQEAFRSDLYYRLKVVKLVMPPLRERAEDVPLLVWHFLRVFAEEHARPVLEVSSEVMDALVRYSWPGNVRELKNLIENLVVFAKGPSLSLVDLPVEVREATSPVTNGDSNAPIFEDLNMDTIERQAIVQALDKTGGNRSKAAQLLGIGLRTLQKKLKDYGMTER